MGVGTFFAVGEILWPLAAVAALGSLFPRHPFDLLYNHGVRFLTGTRPLPPNGAPRRFACGLAAAWLSATALAFGSGMMLLGYVLGTILTATATLVSVSHFCIPSLIYRTLFSGRSRART